MQPLLIHQNRSRAPKPIKNRFLSESVLVIGAIKKEFDMGVYDWRPWAITLRWLVIGGTIWFALYFGATAAQAQTPPTTDADQTCADCHEAENEAWHASPHATTIDPLTETGGATCVDCHGEYIEEHPRADMMTLAVDSAICADCHEETFHQWEGTTHAEADVQCISCHLSHSQELRLTDETLCVSCHQQPIEDQFHTAHWVDDVPCSDCHVGQPTAGANALASSDLTGMLLAPSHDFVTVAADSCLDCHREDVQEVSWTAPKADETVRTASLATQLHSAQNQLRTMGILTPVALGIGVSLGGFLGIVFMLFVSRCCNKEEQ
jgi:nitrate/TMAO reductase-like tetraheme cytochrome c subunit